MLQENQHLSDNSQPSTHNATPGSSGDTMTLSGRRVNPPKPPAMSYDDWSEAELETLLEAVSTHGTENIELLQTYVKTKTAKDIQDHFRKLRMVKKRYMRSVKAPKAPIEAWLGTISKVIGDDSDNSNILANVLSIAGHLEPHNESTEGANEPKFSNIYKFLASLMSDEKPVDLTNVEAALVLELLQGLSDKLQSYDTSNQREMMMQKFEEIHSKGEAEEITDATSSGIDSQSNTETDKKANKSKGHKVAQKRPALFSINPFAIPVKYLKLEKHESTE